MELKEFIKIGINSIVNAINELNDALPDGVIVSPPSARVMIDGNQTMLVSRKNGQDSGLIHNAEFDLSIADAKTKSTGGDVGATIIEVNLNNSTGNETRNRIKFSIPVVYPSPETK